MFTKTISIRLSLLTYFISTVLFVALTLISVQYYYNNRLAQSAAQETFELVSENLNTYLNERSNQFDLALSLMGSEKGLVGHNISDEHPLAQRIMTALMRKSPEIFAVYLGRQTGDFYQLINVESDPLVKVEYKLSDAVRWLEIRITGEGTDRESEIRHLDNSLKVLEVRQEKTRFRPEVRPWYLQANISDKTIQTEPYWFNEIEGAGITLAQKHTELDGVIAIDLTIKNYSQFLKEQLPPSVEEIMLFDSNGLKFASSSELKRSSRSLFIVPEVQAVQLSEQEQRFIESNPVITITNERDWAPFDFTEQGNPVGYSVDLIKLLEAKTGINFKFVNGLSWTELVDLFEQGRIDVLQSTYYEPEREVFGVYTNPMYTIANQLITTKNAKWNSLDTMSGKKLALVNGWSTIDFVSNNYPDIEILSYNTPLESYLAVSKGEADATIGFELALAYYSRKLEISNLKTVGWVADFDNQSSKSLHMLVRPDFRILAGILNKALAQITDAEQQSLDARWRLETEVLSSQGAAPSALLLAAITGQDHLVTFEKVDEQGELERFFGYTSPLNTDGSKAYIGIRASVDEILGPYVQQVFINLAVALLIVVFAVGMVIWITRRILRPIRLLMHENNKISQRKYAEVRPVKTRITEFQMLSRSLINMSENIRENERNLEELMESLIQLIADAIDAKSPYTGGHCHRVPNIAMALAEEAGKQQSGPFKDFAFANEDERREFRIGAWLHDCGKVITPEHVVDKATKLETIYNRIHEIRTRFEVLWRDAEISALNRRIQGESTELIDAWLASEQQKLRDDFAFIAESNVGGEFMSDDKVERIQQIAAQTWTRHFSKEIGLSVDEERRLGKRTDNTQALAVQEKLLDDKPEHIVPREHFDHESYAAQGFKTPVPENLYNHGEVYNLCTKRGTLTNEERYKINEHVIMTIRMLEQLPLPSNLSRVPEYAGTHHETLLGTGYPRQLTKEQLSIPARIMAMADIFEALTASDRPYKKGKTISEAMKIMGFMVKDQHIDADVFELFLRSGLYKTYAQAYLKTEQIDEIDINDYILNRQHKPKVA